MNESRVRAEVISIGDEMTSGQRLDTNSRWLSQQLGDLGINVAFHSTVGDDLSDNVDVFRIAANRADIVIATGGLGPTKDDLTRQAIADAAGVELEFDQSIVEHIERIFASFGREMPENNKVQAWFPKGSTVIPNPEGTAPGIDYPFARPDKQPSRIFALPGVPAEMKQMWESYLETALRQLTGETKFIHHHVVHCFGVGESQAEQMVPDLIRRGREPRVGITASAATISFRITARANTKEECIAQMQPTLQTISECMGEHVFGENGTTLEEVVCHRFTSKNQNLAVIDFGLDGDVGRTISMSPTGDILALSSALKKFSLENELLSEDAKSILAPYKDLDLTNAQDENAVGSFVNELARVISQRDSVDFALVIGPVDKTEKVVKTGGSYYQVSLVGPDIDQVTRLRFGGHTAIRRERAVKTVLNFVRLALPH